jgi:hypothetical protein
MSPFLEALLTTLPQAVPNENEPSSISTKDKIGITAEQGQGAAGRNGLVLGPTWMDMAAVHERNEDPAGNYHYDIWVGKDF